MAATASERAREAVILGLPFSRFCSSAFGIGAATGIRLSVLSTRAARKNEFARHEHHLVVALADQNLAAWTAVRSTRISVAASIGRR